MDAFLSAHQETIKRVMKGVGRYDHDLKSLSTWWKKIALIGKINSFEVASTILQDMDKTLDQFNHLRERLVESLINEHTRKILVNDISRCHMAIDVLLRNLFERTADIGFLSTDFDVIRFLRKTDSSAEDREAIKHFFQGYVTIYSVYQDAILLKPDGEVVFQLSQPDRTGKISDAFVKHAVEAPDEYVEYFGETQLTRESSESLLYAHAVVDGNEVIGVIILGFRFQNEMKGIVDRLLSPDDNNCFLLLDGAGNVLFRQESSRHPHASRLKLTTSPQVISITGKSMVAVSASGQAYQGYAGPEGWHVGSLMFIEDIEIEPSRGTPKETGSRSLSDHAGLIPGGLLDIRHQAMSINNDLQLIILNGIITSARENAVEFMPVLEAIRSIGRDIDNVFSDSIESLFSAIISSQLNTIRLQASLAVDIMDRNLYERANDCRWWGLSHQLRSALSATEVDKESVKQTLAKIHALYTVYHTLYVYDKQGCYVAFSDDTYNDKVGKAVEPDSGMQEVFKLNGIYDYSVSPFKPFECYQGESTYIYNGAIRDLKRPESILGGIGIVFDSTVEFKAMLNDILPRDGGVIRAGSSALFTTDTGLVIASTSPEHATGETFWHDIDRAQLHNDGSTASAVSVGGNLFLVGAAVSEGYREYKRQDGYENTLIAWVLTPC